MLELINKQSALSVCKEYCWLDDEDFIEGYNTAIKDIREAIKELPTIEPEVRHARWAKSASGELYCPYCSYIPQWDDDKYCANCGARMDGGADNATD